MTFKNFSFALLITIIFSATAHSDECATLISSVKGKHTMKAAYDISCRGYYIFFLDLHYKDHIKRKLIDGSNRFRFFDTHNENKEITEPSKLKFIKNVYVNNELVLREKKELDIDLPDLGISVYNYTRKLLSFGTKRVVIELTFLDSDEFFDRFTLFNLNSPRRSGLLFF